MNNASELSCRNITLARIKRLTKIFILFGFTKFCQQKRMETPEKVRIDWFVSPCTRLFYHEIKQFDIFDITFDMIVDIDF